ncbi:MAG: diacylglycerol kinase [Gallionella sp.]|nr:diacylglycerol kinase [Gallionella sp.]
MKNQAFAKRFANACNGISCAFSTESSFRTELAFGLCVLGVALWMRPEGVWIALLVIMVTLVLAAELFNTSLEHALDGLHPDEAEFVRIAKDCAAAAVLLLSIASVLVFLLMVWNKFS